MPGNNCTFAGTAAEWGILSKITALLQLSRLNRRWGDRDYASLPRLYRRYRQPANRLSTFFSTLSISLPMIPMVSMPTIIVSVWARFRASMIR